MKISHAVMPANKNKIAKALSVVFVLCLLIRATILGNYIPPDLVENMNYGGLIACALYIFFKFDKRVNVFAAALLFFACLSVAFSPYFQVSLIRTGFWALIFIVAGPMLKSKSVDEFREFLWRDSTFVIILITVLSLFWNIAGLPVYGKGMAGITTHTMLLGALAGIAVVLLFNKILEFNSRTTLSIVLFFVSSLSCMISGSRSAVVSAITGIAVASLLKFRGIVRYTAYSVLLFTAAFAWQSISNGDKTYLDQDFAANQFTAELAQKGTSNSRKELWANRIQEFVDKPIAGVGIGVDTFQFRNSLSGSNVIEPGSSYLAVLSMTGLLGSVGLFIMLLALLRKVFKRRHKIGRNRFIEMISLGAFWAVYAIGEGWIFAGGSFICFCFWMWVGRLAALSPRVIADV